MSLEGIDRNYKIPKRKSDEMTTDYSNGGSNGYNAYSSTDSPVLAGSYYNYYETPGLYGPWQQQGVVYPTQYPVTPTPTNTTPVVPITQNIYNALSNIQEKPKNYKRNIFKEVVPDVDDTTLPKELTSMFQPLYCKLCTAQLSSNVMAKLHYKSRNHEKKVRKFLIEHSQKTGEPLHKRAKVTETAKVEEDKNPAWFHCDMCDLPLTGKLHAESHYMGKNHQKALLGYRPPAGKGYYNEEGKWVRQGSKKGLSLPEGEDGFGVDFRKTEPEAPKPVAVPATVTTVTATSVSSSKSKFHCEICNVAATCQEQIEMHYKGQKHQKKMRQLGLTPANFFTNVQPQKSDAEVAKPLDNINLSVYRTPSGDFYCPSCNLTLNSEPQFKIHLRSKGHLKKQQKQ
ncbi:zinc finger matrin-type protein 4-like [Anoplophora glabripennis]|uniref:zinc finger matrin-type protein 4-like n=1 Tax=Anoplophora glabripennis TaxID=217634 RepID=UPI000875954B|nr:zinc finger matrin-type protein 4-like [Anoplophora glabripennis]